MKGPRGSSYAVRVAVVHALYYLGLLHVWQRLAMRQRAVVLMYHRVLTPDERRASASHPAIVVDRETFARQMAILKRRFVVLSVDEFASHLEHGRPFPDSSCVITFDDGWHDSFTNAFPILVAEGLPAVVFLPVNYIGTDRVFWQEALTHVLTRAVLDARSEPRRRERLQQLLSGTALDSLLDVAAPDPQPAIIAAIGAQKRFARADVEARVAALANELGLRLGDLARTDGFINWDQVRQMSEAGIAFGGHGADHLLLTQVSRDQAQQEIGESLRVLGERVGEDVAAFSYPNGYRNTEVTECVRRSGYRLAFTTRGGFVRAGDDCFSIARFNIHEGVTDTTPTFLARVLGLL